MKLNLCKIFTEFHGVSKWPLMSPNFTKRSSHEDSSNFIYDQKFCNIIWISPHNSEFLSSPISIKFGDTIGIAHSHDIKHTVKGRTDTFTIFIPNFKQFLTLAVHNHTASISKHSLDEEVLI
jgi:hypothetical protein